MTTLREAVERPIGASPTVKCVVPPELLDRLKAEAERRGVLLSVVMRELLERVGE